MGWKDDVIGALWLRNTKRGEFLTGEMEKDVQAGTKIKLMENKYYEEGGNKPYYHILINNWDGNKNERPAKNDRSARDDVGGDDIPF